MFFKTQAAVADAGAPPSTRKTRPRSSTALSLLLLSAILTAAVAMAGCGGGGDDEPVPHLGGGSGTPNAPAGPAAPGTARFSASIQWGRALALPQQQTSAVRVRPCRLSSLCTGRPLPAAETFPSP